MVQNSVKSVITTSINGLTFDGTYKVLNSDGLPNPCFYITIHNRAKNDVFISYDGITDHDFLKHGTWLHLPFQGNSSPPGFVSKFKKGQKVYIKGPLSIGYVYLIGYYN